MASTCRVPRHVRLLLQQREQKQGYEHDANVPRLEVRNILNVMMSISFLRTFIHMYKHL